MDGDLDFVIIGAQKGGSTLLARGLGQHPQIWMPPTETPVFRDPLYSDRAAAELRRTVQSQGNGQLCGIKCPDYLGRPEVPPRLAAQARRPRLVLCLRNPVARAISTYFWHVRWGLLPIEDPSAGMHKVLDGAYAARDPRAGEIVDWSLYGKHLDRYLSFFPLDDIHVLLNDELRTDPDLAFGDTFRFLSVSDDFRPRVDRASTNEGVYSIPRLRFLNLRNRLVQRWDTRHEYVDVRPPARLGPRMASIAVAAIDRYVLARIFGNRKPRIDPSVVARLNEVFAPDVERLELLLDRDFGAWKT